MRRPCCICGLIAILGLSTVAKGQLLNGDANFPIINELRWELTMSEVQSLCERHHVALTPTDSAIVITVPVLGFASRTELQFNGYSKTLKSVQAKFNDPTKLLADSITSYLTRTMGREPVRTVKEKSLLIITIRVEMALWNSSAGLVNLVTAMRGDSMIDASLVLFPPTAQQAAGSKK
jgi:hypothetical protein